MPTAQFSVFPPNGIDRADGSQGIGTPTPDGAIAVQGSDGIDGGQFEELPESPEIERAEQATLVHRFKCDQDTGQGIILGMKRGDVLLDSQGNFTRVLSVRYQQNKGGFCEITITAEGLNFDPPPDQFRVEVVDLSPSIFRHPRYSATWDGITPTVTNYQTTDGGGVVHYLGPTIIGAINNALNAPQPQTQTEQQNLLTSYFQSSPGATLTSFQQQCLNLALELLGKLRLGIDTFYLAGFKVTFSVFNFVPWLINPGGYIEDPVASGNLPFYFWSDTGDPSGANIFTTLGPTIAPQFYKNGISWLRESDSQDYERTWFKITQTWIGGPYGQWDQQIYNSLNVPTIAYG